MPLSHAEKPHHPHLKKLFKKELPKPNGDLESSGHLLPSSHSLSKLFHHHEPEKEKHLSRTPLTLLLRRNRSNLMPVREDQSEDHKKLSRAETLSHIQHLNNKNAAARAAAGPGGINRTPRNVATHYPHHDKIVYNPFGLNKTPSTEQPKNTSFYMNGGADGARVLANPVADPNDYLPEELHQDHVNLLDDFEIDVAEKRIGDGGSSDVRKIHAVAHKKQCYALKKFTLLHNESDEDFYKRASKEFIIAKKAAMSRHVVDTLAILRILSLASLSRGWGFVLEYCGGGDLFNTIIKPGWKRTPLNERYCIFKQIAYGLKFLHDNDIVHKDLKPENVLLDNCGVAKLCDFGVSDFGHEVEGDLSSPIKTSTAYVGSPPYSPPEVMKLKEVSQLELKNWAYNPFKMDHWGLGMLLFCIVYCGVPFQQAVSLDHGFRDYKFNRDRFASDHPSFKNNKDYSRGPGSEFKWASQFQLSGAARVAWKLCDPSITNRYDMELLFNDPWFKTLEMCLYEHPDQTVNPFIFSGSNPQSHQNSRPPSRKNTYTSLDDEGLHTPVKSMLDLADHAQAALQLKDNDSIHSASSLTKQSDSASSVSRQDLVSRSRASSNERKPLKKVKSMLDFSDDVEETVSQPPSAIKMENDLPSVAEDEEVHIEPDIATECQEKDDGPTDELKERRPSDFFHHEPLRSNSMMQLDYHGTCEFGYKIKKHHHLDISNAAVAGSMSRRALYEK